MRTTHSSAISRPPRSSGVTDSIDWLCLPHFNSGACFAALLGTADHGRWLLAPAMAPTGITRSYRDSSLVLETEFVTETGAVKLTDCMPPRAALPGVVRFVEGLRGEVVMRMELIIRFDYGSIVPWVRTVDGVLHATGGPDAVALWSPVPMRGKGLTTIAEFTVREGERVPFVLVWHPSHTEAPERPNPIEAVAATDEYWRTWARAFSYDGRSRDAVLRSAITLKALTFAPTAGILAAPTTSLPERIGGVRNWDYRHCWLRDATFTLYALMICGFRDEAAAWHGWLLRAVAGDPSELQIMYGPSGERRLTELELPWLPGYEASAPVRIGNAATTQLQLDVYGEVMDTFHVARHHGLAPEDTGWALQVAILKSLESLWTEPDDGIWEIAWPPPPLHPLQGDGLGRVRPWRQGRRAVRSARTGGPMEDRPRSSARRNLRSRVQRHQTGVHPVLRVRRAGRQLVDAASRRFPSGKRPADARHGRGHRTGADR